jgi:hypothetical protein
MFLITIHIQCVTVPCHAIQPKLHAPVKSIIVIDNSFTICTVKSLKISEVYGHALHRNFTHMVTTKILTQKYKFC